MSHGDIPWLTKNYYTTWDMKLLNTDKEYRKESFVLPKENITEVENFIFINHTFLWNDMTRYCVK